MGISEIIPSEKELSYMNELTVEGESKLDGLNVGNVYGSYVHGIFDYDNVAGTMVAAVLKDKGIEPGETEKFDMAQYKEKQYDMLADAVRENLDMKEIYEILNKGI